MAVETLYDEHGNVTGYREGSIYWGPDVEVSGVADEPDEELPDVDENADLSTDWFD